MSNTHILQKMGVLRSFQIARFVPDSDLKKIQEELKSLPKKEREAAYEKKLEEISESSRDLDKMPGVITPESEARKVETLLRLSIDIANGIQSKGFTKEEQSFIIVSLTKLLELKLKNFKDWKESKKDDDDDQEYDDRDDED